MKADRLIELVLSGVPANLAEAVDSIPHAEAVLQRYHYDQDPRQDSQKKSRYDKWYVNEDQGHSVFLFFDPAAGVNWHFYQAQGKNAPYVFYKGHGVKSLDGYLDTLHGRGR